MADTHIESGPWQFDNTCTFTATAVFSNPPTTYADNVILAIEDNRSDLGQGMNWVLEARDPFGAPVWAVAEDLSAGLDDGLVLIGDPGYYGRFFGLTAERTGAWRLPGPVERHRLLARDVEWLP